MYIISDIEKQTIIELFQELVSLADPNEFTKEELSNILDNLEYLSIEKYLTLSENKEDKK